MRQVPNSLLKQYFKQKNIDIGLDWNGLGEKQTEAVFAALRQLPPEDYQDVETGFTMINELACTAVPSVGL